MTNGIWPAELKFMTALRRKLNLPLNSIYSLLSCLPLRVLKFKNGTDFIKILYLNSVVSIVRENIISSLSKGNIPAYFGGFKSSFRNRKYSGSPQLVQLSKQE